MRLKDHFLKTDDGYQVRTHISRMIVWTDHNLIEHPPFSNLHLISCRNVMIYFQPRLQERLRGSAIDYSRAPTHCQARKRILCGFTGREGACTACFHR